MSILVRGCASCPFLHQATDIDGFGRAAYCMAASFLKETDPPPSPRRLEAGPEYVTFPDWCPLRSMAITVRMASVDRG